MIGRLKRFRVPKINTIIGNETRIEGDLKFTGGLHVDGVIRGNVIANGEGNAALILSEQGVVEGDVRVPYIILNGKVVGDVYSSERVELAANARVTGTLYYKLLEMVMGAEVNGQLISSEELSTNGKDTDVAVQKTDVAVQKADVAVQKTDVAVQKTDVAVQKTPGEKAKAVGPTNMQAAAGSITTSNS